MDSATIDKLHNAYWRMDDALSVLQAGKTPAEMAEAWRAHGLLWDILKDIDPAMTENIRPGDDLSPANNND